MAMVGKVDLPVFKQGLVGMNYLAFGVVFNCAYIDWDSYMIDNGWDSIFRNHERLMIFWITVADKRDNNRDAIPLLVQVKVIEKKSDG